MESGPARRAGQTPDRGRAEQLAFENLEYIGVRTDEADVLPDLLASASDAELRFLAQCSLDEFLASVHGSRTQES